MQSLAELEFPTATETHKEKTLEWQLIHYLTLYPTKYNSM